MTAGALPNHDAARPHRRLIVFADDWGRHPSSAQHIGRELAESYRIDWIHTIGTRRPRASVADVRRSLGKLGEWARGPAAIAVDRGDAPPPSVTLHAPLLAPTFGSRVGRRFNARRLTVLLRKLLNAGPPPDAVVTTIPLVADVARALPHLRWIYYCTDAMADWPGLDRASLEQMEGALLATVDEIVVTSEVLLRDLRERSHIEPRLLTHGVDLDAWHVERRVGTRSARPRALYWGHVDERVDVELCLGLAEDVDLTFIGPHARAPSALLKHPHITFEDAVPQSNLCRRAVDADVLVLPYRSSAATKAMQPLKLKEYLATMLPVVSTDLPAVAPWRDALDVADSRVGFARAVLEAAQRGLSGDQRRARARLASESWRAKANEFAEIVGPPAQGPCVLHVRCCSGPGSGPEKTLLRSHRGLAERGYRTVVAILRDPKDREFDHVAKEARAEGATLISIDDRGPLDRSILRQLIDVVDAMGVTVWHGHDYKSNLLGLLARRRRDVGLVSTAHGWVHHTRRTPAYYALDRWCLRRYDHVVAVSTALGEECVHAGVPKERLSVVPNAIDCGESPFTLPNSNGTTKSSRFRIGGVGRLAEEKGFLDLFEASRALRERGVPVDVTLFGEGPQRGALEDWIARHGAARWARLAGHVHDRIAIYESLDLFVLSSVREGLPNALLEALAHGVPVVATRVGGVPDILVDGENSLLCDVGDRAQIESAMDRMFQDAAARSQFARAGRMLVEERFSFAVRIQRMADIYDAIPHGRRKRNSLDRCDELHARAD